MPITTRTSTSTHPAVRQAAAAFALASAGETFRREPTEAAATNLRLAAHALRTELGCAS